MIIAQVRWNQTHGEAKGEARSNPTDQERAMLMRLRREGEGMVAVKGPEPIEAHPAAVELAELVGTKAMPAELDTTTDHAFLVVLGHFAQALGLVEALVAVPLGQRHGPNGPPQAKLIEFLVGILGGVEYLQDLNHSAEPIATDATVAQAWGQMIFSHNCTDRLVQHPN